MYNDLNYLCTTKNTSVKKKKKTENITLICESLIDIIIDHFGKEMLNLNT